MKTLRLAIDPAHLDSADARQAIAQAAEILRRGRLVALPTETVYGLGAHALDVAAVARIFEAKQRPAWDPVIVHIAGPVTSNPMLDALVTEVPTHARALIAAFWPGPLTLLLPRSTAVPDAVTAGRPLVGIRMPAHPVAFALIQQAGIPIAAPSANRFGHTSPTTADHVLDDLDGRIDAILDAGPTQHGLESTVLDPNQSPMRIYRPGAISAEQIRAVAGPAENYSTLHSPASEPIEALPSPGVGIRHYAPRARLILLDAPLPALRDRLADAVKMHAGESVGILLPAELSDTPAAKAGENLHVYPWGRWSSHEELARNLYAGMRALDAAGCAVILCPLPPAEGLGAAIRDRLRKAAL
ncbi:MAG: L-threonylcarbamoyladenylate synthase [Terracidiphilus sp.]